MKSSRSIPPTRPLRAAALLPALLFFAPAILAVAILAVAILAVAFLAAAAPAAAQGTPEPAALNLSNSGSSSAPAVVVDEQNGIHAVWYDLFAGNQYAYSADGLEWTAPVAVRFPFGESQPALLLGPDDTIHAYWLSTTGDLNTSWASSARIAEAASWSAVRLIAQNVVTFDVAVDNSSRMHMVFMVGDEAGGLDAGLYYVKSILGGKDWLPKPAQVYTSPYFRGTNPASSHLQIAVSPGEAPHTLMIAWDERPLQKVMMSRSVDEGETWSEAQNVDRPDSQSGFLIAQQINVAFLEDTILLTWSKGADQGNCSHNFQVSTDNGETWTIPSEIIADTTGCPEQSLLFDGAPGQVIWNVTIDSQVYLVAWDGARWSEPQVQPDLTTFLDPETSQILAMGCRQFAYIPAARRLAAVGCDLEVRNDIWFVSLDLQDTAAWFLSETSWTRMVDIASFSEMDSFRLLADQQGGFHAIWVQPEVVVDQSRSNSDIPKVIYYSVQDNQSWTMPVRIQRSPTGDAGQVSAVLDAKNELLLTWWSQQDGELFFSKADLGKASVLSEWSELASLPLKSRLTSSPGIQVDDAGSIYVTYAVPLNEGRGVYLVRSPDGGRTWTEPALVFDADAALWEKVDRPVLTAADGILHMVWARETALAGAGPVGLYYSRSTDQGATWGEAEAVTEAQALWGQVAAASSGRLYRIWQELQDGQSAINMQFSDDGGRAWSSASSILDSGDPLRKLAVQPDGLGQIHLMQLVKEPNSAAGLRHWISSNDTWVASESLEVGSGQVAGILDLQSAISPQGKLAALVAIDRRVEVDQPAQAVLQFTSRQLDAAPLSPVAVENRITPEPSAMPTPQPTQTPLALPTPTLDRAALNAEPEQPAGDSWFGLILGIVFSALIVGFVFVISLVRSRKLVRKYRKNSL